MKTYLKPELEIDLFQAEDVIVCSGEQDIEIEWYRPDEDDE